MIGFKKYLEEGRGDALKAFDSLVKRGGSDKRTFQKASDLYRDTQFTKLKKLIADSDTDVSEAIASLIQRHDSKVFNSMYPRAKSGDYLSDIIKMHEDVDYNELEEGSDGLAAKAKKSGISVGTLKKVYDRGVAAWKTGHRPGTTPQQWGMARVNAFIVKKKKGGLNHDKDLA